MNQTIADACNVIAAQLQIIVAANGSVVTPPVVTPPVVTPPASSGWRAFRAPMMDAIDTNFNAFRDAGNVNAAYIYVAYAAPNRLPLRYFSKEYGIMLFTGFSSSQVELYYADYLGFTDSEGFPGGVQIVGSTLNFRDRLGQFETYPLPYGGLSYHNTPDPTLPTS